MKKREILAGGLGVAALGTVAANNPSTIGSLAFGTAGAVSAVGNGVVNILNTIAPTASAAINAPLASAVSSAYLANGAMNMIGVENKIARYAALAGSSVVGFGAGVVAQKLLIGAAVAKGTWDIGKMAWNSEAIKKLSTPKVKSS